MTNTERVFHPDLQKEEREPVPDVLRQVDQGKLKMCWMKNEDSPELSRRAAVALLIEAAGTAVVSAFGAWLSMEGRSEQDVINERENHDIFQSAMHSEQRNGASLPLLVQNPTPSGQK